MPEFEPWPKMTRIPKLKMWITEMVDGTNAQILVEEDRVTLIGARNRAIEPNIPKTETEAAVTRDNAGFARWVRDNEAQLCELLGPGRHYGEWAGPGINKNRHQLTGRYFFLFNWRRWDPTVQFVQVGDAVVRPVPLLYEGPLDTKIIEAAMGNLKADGSHVGSGPPEGIVVSTLGTMIKDTYEARGGKWAE